MIDDNEPVTAEWLLDNGWSLNEPEDNPEFLSLNVGEDRRLVMCGLSDELSLERLNRRTFEWEYLCDFAPIPTRGHARRLHAILGVGKRE